MTQTIVQSDMLLIGVLLVGMLLGGLIVYLGGRFMCVLLLLATLTGCAAPPYVCLPRTIDDERGFLCVPLERRTPEPAALSNPHLYGRPSTVFYEMKCEG